MGNDNNIKRTENKGLTSIQGGWRIELINIILAAIIGTAAFLMIYGITPLDPTSDSWIMAGYDEPDIIQHYSGWIAFRNSEWAFPIGLAKDMAIEEGTFVSYTDSIPWVAILFKAVRKLLPGTFQYFGLYALFCYILQAVAAFKILFYKTNNQSYSFLGIVLFVFAPILLERSFRHTALGSQWLILFAIYVWMRNRNAYRVKNYVVFLILLVLAIGIHPYFLPMIAVFMLLTVIEDCLKKKYISIVWFIISLLITYGAGCLIGVLGTGIETSRWGYGIYSMNLNAVLNPTSCGKYTWSSLFKIHPQILGNYDGFNYIGAGVFTGILIVAVILMIFGRKKEITAWIQRNTPAILLMICCTIFAVSNVVTFNDRILLEIELPVFLSELCGIFRASSRIFYPVYYCIFLTVIITIWKYRNKLNMRNVYLLLGMICIIQLFDIHNCIVEKHHRMDANYYYTSILDDEALNDIFKNNKYVLLDRSTGDNRSLAVAALKNNDKLYYSVANSGNYWKTSEEAARIINTIKDNGQIGSNVIVTSRPEILNQYLMYKDIGYYKLDENYYVGNINSSNYLISKDVNEVYAADFTDDNWTNGISNSNNNELLFNNTKYNNMMLTNAKRLFLGEKQYEIINMVSDSDWIHIYLDKDASACSYPSALSVDKE